MNPHRIIRLPEVLHLTGLSRTTLWRKEQGGDFPSRLRLGVNSVGWLYADVAAWIASRAAVSPRIFDEMSDATRADG